MFIVLQMGAAYITYFLNSFRYQNQFCLYSI